MEYNKLVRDKIPSIIEKEGAIPVIRILESLEYAKCLEKKLDEEVDEYHKSKSLDELADVLEVLYALVEVNGYSKTELYEAYWKKHIERGGFRDKIFLVRKIESIL